MATPVMTLRGVLHPSLPMRRIRHAGKVWEALSGIRFEWDSPAVERADFQLGPEPMLEGIPFLKASPYWHDCTLRQPPQGSLRDVPTLFPVADSRSLLPYDPFLASFWVVTEAEKYAPDFPKDNLGRYDEKAMWVVRSGTFRRPVVHYWLSHFLDALGRPWKPERSVTVEWTVDVDLPWGYCHRPWWRQLLKAFRHGHLPPRKDPYDVRHGLLGRLDPSRTTFFFPDGGEHHPWPFEFPPYARMIAEVARAGYEIALHGSIRAAIDPERLQQEKQRLERIAGRPIRKNRQHFLQYRLPLTYQALVDAGINADYTTCGASYAGFKHGVARPIPWYDLQADAPAPLTLVPTVVMDRALMRTTSPHAAPDLFEGLMEETARWNGTVALLWHNAILSGDGEWRIWQPVFEKTLHFLSVPLRPQ